MDTCILRPKITICGWNKVLSRDEIELATRCEKAVGEIPNVN